MKKFGVFLAALLMSTGISAQSEAGGKQSLSIRMAEKNILNHMDVGVDVGTMGIGINVAVPVGDYVRVRAGYNFMPPFTHHEDVNVETRSGATKSSFANKFSRINEILSDNGIDLDWPDFREEKELMESLRDGSLGAKNYVMMDMKPSFHQFKLLVDVLPFKNNKHWSFTAGFFIGPSRIGKAYNQDGESALLKAVNLYNNRYYKDYVLNDMYFRFVDGDGMEHHGEIIPLTSFVKRNGLAGFSLGTFCDDGRKAMMVPAEDATVRAEMKTSVLRPYLGFGYNTHLSKDKRWRLDVDAGIMFLCGAPSVYVDNVYKIDASELRFDESWNYAGGIGLDANGKYYGDIVRFDPYAWTYVECGEKVDHVDLIHDLKDIPGKVGDMVHTVSKLKVYPNASVTFSYRLF